jgi:hypothetical protein
MFSKLKGRAKFPPRANIAIALSIIPLAACLQVCEAQQAGQRTFNSAEEASHALFVAVEADAQGAVDQILGQDTVLVSSGAADQDKLDRAQFVRKYREMHRLARESNGEVVLYIGAENWPFPIPLVSHDGAWHYDSEAGENEVLNRRIGENEVTVIELCHALMDTLEKPQAHADASNPVGALLTAARADYKPVAFHGYSFRLLSKSGNKTSAVIAYPTVYGSSGVMTFVVGRTGVVYQKDLGASTTRIASGITEYHLDKTWAPAETAVETTG